jgi:TetR/AcrR family transcriptional regulator of autoinduction and epiphytic fitness
VPEKFKNLKRWLINVTTCCNFPERSEKHADILSAAIEEFAEKGMMATTMEAIAKRAQVSKRTLYKHYCDKQQLLDDVVHLLIEQFKPLQQIQYQPAEDFIAQLKHIGQLSMAINRDPDFIKLSRIVIIESMRCPKAAEKLNAQFQQCEIGLQCWFSQAKASGAIGSLSADFIAAVFYGTLKKAGYWDQAIKWKTPLSAQEAKQLVEQLCQLVSIAIEHNTQNDSI